MTAKSALITGSTRGLGLDIAVALARAGYSVTLNGLDDETTVEAAKERIAEASGQQASFSPVDIRDPSAVQGLVDAHLSAFGSLEVLVNNAGIQHVAPIDEFPVDRWQAILDINLSGVFFAIRAALPAMKTAGFGRIINLASAHGLVASEFKSAYVAAKHGLIGLTKVVALETARLDITCNAICPGYVRTPLVDAQIQDQARAHGIPEDQVIQDVILAKHPNKRFVAGEQVGALAVFLASDAGASITGASLPVDGGWTAQ